MRFATSTLLYNSYKNNIATINSTSKNSKINTNNSTSSKTSNTQKTNYKKSVEGLVSGKFETLQAKDNVLDIKSGVNYKVKTLMHGYSELKFDNGNARWLWSDYYENVDCCEGFSDDELDDIQNTKLFMNSLSLLASKGI